MAEDGGGIHLLEPTAATAGHGGLLHQRVREVVLERILSGDAQPGSAMGVSALAKETGVSRTPVRETLLQLQEEGFLRLERNRGFFVAELTEEEARELYPILHALEDLALVSGGRPPNSQIRKLESLNSRLGDADDPDSAIALNFAWHRALTRSCRNRELLSLLEQYRMRVYRYERAYYGPGEARLAYSVELHREIQEALAAGDLGRARTVLERHWVGDYSLYLPRRTGRGSRLASGGGRQKDGG